MGLITSPRSPAAADRHLRSRSDVVQHDPADPLPRHALDALDRDPRQQSGASTGATQGRRAAGALASREPLFLGNQRVRRVLRDGPDIERERYGEISTGRAEATACPKKHNKRPKRNGRLVQGSL